MSVTLNALILAGDATNLRALLDRSSFSKEAGFLRNFKEHFL
jgi:hypothetical protein